MDAFVIMILGCVFLGTATSTLFKFMDYRVQMAERRGRRGDPEVLQAVQELRAEIAALKRQESEAVLSFDSTLQTLDARLKHLERRGLQEGAVPLAPRDGADSLLAGPVPPGDAAASGIGRMTRSH